MLDVAQFRTFIVRPVLKHLDMWSDVAENLVVGTAIQETRLTYLKQLGGGPALGVFQMEPNTHDDLWTNYIRFRTPLVTKLQGLSTNQLVNAKFITVPAQEMIGNLYYAAAMCRIHYKRVPAALPSNDLNEIASYWKQHYNTEHGAGTVNEFISNYKKYNKFVAPS